MTRYNDSVSIIIPVYNTEDYLPACIDSLCIQSYSYIQIILVDDESQDKSSEICDYYADIDNRITVIHQKNGGVSGARNTGMKHATGEFVMFVDSDDGTSLVEGYYTFDKDDKMIIKNGPIDGISIRMVFNLRLIN